MNSVAAIAFLVFFSIVSVAMVLGRRLQKRIELDEAENVLRDEIERVAKDRRPRP